MHRIAVLASIMAIAPVYAQAFLTQNNGPFINVGSSIVKGQTIKPFTATWSMKQPIKGEWREVATITETLKQSKVDEKLIMVREQITRIPSTEGQQIETISFNPETLEPISLKVESKGKFPPQAVKEGHVDYKGTLVTGSLTTFEDKTVEIKQENTIPMFETAMLGLIIAALPLKEGYTAELPANFVLQGTKWFVRVRVSGRKTFDAGNGKKVEAWAVETDWREAKSDSEYSYSGGTGGSGGTYYVVPNPPSGFPLVPQYINSSVNIEVIPAK